MEDREGDAEAAGCFVIELCRKYTYENIGLCMSNESLLVQASSYAFNETREPLIVCMGFI